jgi:ferredoxin--NADP+ reductase
MSTLGTESNPLNVAIIGSGPSGFYAAEALIRSDLIVKVDLIERLPNPYGLVRSGVAPDHPKLKQAILVYDKTAQSEDFNFIGNVCVGKDISVDELREHYHALIFTCGAETDRRLGIPGEDLPGSYTATEFVGWYNGHPDYSERKFDLSHETAVIIGQGNVAADVSRILAKTTQELSNTDIAAHAIDALQDSQIKNIYVIGRRGPAQAKFTSKELKEFGELETCHPDIDASELELNPQSQAELEEKTNAGSKKVFDLFNQYVALPESDKPRRCKFTFLQSPVEIQGDGKVEKIILEKNALSGDTFKQSARGTGEKIELETGLVFRSIGYRGLPIEGVPFDERGGIFPNIDGRIIDENQKPVIQMYTAGWIKRGPTGIIGTNRADSVATVNKLLEDIALLDSGNDKSGAEGIYSLLNDRNVRYINYQQWKKIDQAEIERGKDKNKPREKFTTVDEMLTVLD